MVDVTFDNIKDLSEEPFNSSNLAKLEVSSLIKNVLMKYYYNEPNNLIYLISDIFKNLLTSHKLRNGNKRMSSMMLANMLYQQGIFLKGSIKYKCKDFWKINEYKFIEFIKDYDNICVLDDFEIKNHELLLKIYDWIYKSAYISLNFVEKL